MTIHIHIVLKFYLKFASLYLHDFKREFDHLIWSRSLLTSLQLLQVVFTGLHVTAIFF